MGRLVKVGRGHQAGLVSLSDEGDSWGWWVLHCCVLDRRFWAWGFSEDWYDGPIGLFGFGPLFLFAWQSWRRKK